MGYRFVLVVLKWEPVKVKSSGLVSGHWPFFNYSQFRGMKGSATCYLVLSDHEWPGPLGLKVQNSNGSFARRPSGVSQAYSIFSPGTDKHCEVTASWDYEPRSACHSAPEPSATATQSFESVSHPAFLSYQLSLYFQWCWWLSLSHAFILSFFQGRDPYSRELLYWKWNGRTWTCLGLLWLLTRKCTPTTGWITFHRLIYDLERDEV